MSVFEAPDSKKSLTCSRKRGSPFASRLGPVALTGAAVAAGVAVEKKARWSANHKVRVKLFLTSQFNVSLYLVETLHGWYLSCVGTLRSVGFVF